MKRNIIFLLVGLVILIAGGVVFLKKPSPPPQKAQPTPAYSTAPEVTIKNFYKWYLDCQGKYSKSEEYGKLSSSYEYCPWKKSEYISQDLRENVAGASNYDPIICAQNTPNLDEGDITIDKATIFGNKATTTIRNLYSWEDHPIKVELGLFDNQWKITNIICPPTLTPEEVAKEFYAEYINCRGGQIEGVNLSGYCPWEKGKYDGQELVKKIKEIMGYVTSEFIKKIEWGPGVDPILCAQDIPRSIETRKATIVGENATVTITEGFQPPREIKVDLKLLENQWRITNITCQPLQ